MAKHNNFQNLMPPSSYDKSQYCQPCAGDSMTRVVLKRLNATQGQNCGFGGAPLAKRSRIFENAELMKA